MTHRTQHVLMLCNSQLWVIRAKQSKHNHQREKAHWAKCGKPGTSFQVPLTQDSPAGCDTTLGKLTRDSVLRCFTGGWSRRHPLTSMCQNSSLWEGKQVFSINHTVCMKSLGTVSHSYQGMVGTLQDFKFPHTSQGPILPHVFLRMALAGLLC